MRPRRIPVRVIYTVAGILILIVMAGWKWKTLDGQLTNTSGAAIWMDDGKPWAVFNVEDIVLNVDV